MEDILQNLSNLNLTGKVRKISQMAKGGGGFGDVYHGRLLQDGRLVAVKELRGYLQRRNDLQKDLARELMIWSSLSHRNILPLLGFSLDLGRYPAFISEWMPNGNARTYVKENPKVDKLEIVKGIASGLAYLHNKNILHSDLKCDNILMSNDGTPLLCDFGLSRVVVSSHVGGTPSKEFAGSLRWIAVELFDPQISDGGDESILVRKATKETDVWAFAMTISELLSGHVLYYYLQFEGQIIRAIMGGRHPSPSLKKTCLDSVHKNIMKVCERCWNKKPYMRPTIMEITEDLVRCDQLKEVTRPGLFEVIGPQRMTRVAPSYVIFSYLSIYAVQL